jgi:hypothetical protein
MRVGDGGGRDVSEGEASSCSASASASSTSRGSSARGSSGGDSVSHPLLTPACIAWSAVPRSR